VTGDTGSESLIVVWDAFTGVPLKTFFDPSPTGVECLDITSDGRYVVSVSAKVDDSDEPQTMSIWDWTSANDGPLCVEYFPQCEKQVCVKFDPWNPLEVITNGARRVFFWSWSREDKGAKLVCQPPKLNKAKFGQSIGVFTCSTFLVGGKAVTGTVDGDVVVWDTVEGQRNATKLIRLGEGALTVVTIVRDQFLCLAGEDGAVRFYDMHFRLEAWFEDMEAGAITSVSFARDDPALPTRLDFTTPNFVVGTRMAYIVHMESSLFEEVEAESRRGTLLVQGMSDEAHGVAMHPNKTELAIACYSGAVYLWDYVTKVLLMVRQFDSSKLRPRTLCYDPAGTHLMVGFTSGVVKLLEPSTLQDSVTFKNGRDPVILASFSPRGDLFATADASHHVYLHRLLLEEVGEGASTPAGTLGASIRASWCYIGRYRSHSAPIVSLQFGMREGGDQGLFSIGEDKFLVRHLV
jgi:cilia- and flagella-associated protein 251